MAARPGEPRFASLRQQGFRLSTSTPCLLSDSSPLAVAGSTKAYKIPGITARGSSSAETAGVWIKSGANIRATPPPGVFPSQEFRYSFYQEVLPSGGDGGATSSEISRRFFENTRGLVIGLVKDIQIERSAMMTAITVFEGIDIIDLPASQFKRTEKGIEVPHLVYKVIHAGAEKLVSKEGFGLDYWITVGPYLEDNLAQGMVLSDNPPFDVKKNNDDILNRQFFVDTASTVIRVDGDANFVSYVGILRPMWRDVIMTSGSSKEETTFAFGTPLDIATEAGRFTEEKGEISSHPALVLRYTWDDFGTEEEPKRQWRLSESFNVDPEQKVQQPAGVELPGEFRLGRHYVYDLNDKTYPETDGVPIPRILKRAYTKEHAIAKLNLTSSHFDEGFRAVIVQQDASAETVQNPTAPGDPAKSIVLLPNDIEFFAQGVPQYLGGTPALCASTIFGTSDRHAYLFTSPKFLGAFSTNVRVGEEYYGLLRARLQSAILGAVLVRTPAIGWVSASYDPCMLTTSLLDVAGSVDAPVVVERTFDDNRWEKVDLPIPEPERGQFLLGEHPYKNGGAAALLPKTEETDVVIGQDGLVVPNDKIIAGVGLNVEEDAGGTGQGTGKLFTSRTEPEVELSLGEVAPPRSGRMVVNVPSLDYTAFAPGGGLKELDKLYVADRAGKIADSLVAPQEVVDDADGNPVAWLNASNTQINQVGEMVFPVPARSVTAQLDCNNGFTVIAYETEGRIDLGLRATHYGSFTPVRDVVLRIPEEEVEGGNEQISLPAASKPYLVPDKDTTLWFLFFVYKRKIFLKKIPEEIFKDLARQITSNSFTPQTEANAVRTLHSIAVTLIYDSTGETDEGSGGGSIAEDIDAQIIENGEDKEEEEEATSPASFGIIPFVPFGVQRFVAAVSEEIAEDERPATPRFLIDYSAFRDNKGNVFLIVYDTQRTWLFRSLNSGRSYRSILPATFSFLPLTDEEKEEREQFEGSFANPVQYPYVLVDESTHNCHLFFFSEAALLLHTFPIETLLLEPDKIEEALALIKPRFLHGRLTKTLVDRGIVPIRPNRTPEEEESSSLATVPAQRVSGVITTSGYLRVFFKDEDGIVASLISSNSGATWFTDQEYSSSPVPQETA
jgi:hypothetical protein